MKKTVKKIKYSIKYPTYRCRCGRKLIPSGSPSRCPHCGQVTILR